MHKYLEKTKYVDFDDPLVLDMAMKLKSESSDEISLIENTYHYVRDAIHHSWDVQDKRVTVTASDVIREGVGICWAKSNLLAALLRANGIPTGFSYQRLTLGDTVDTGYCIHGLNTVYVSSLNKWIRLDARGNKNGVNARFSLDEEYLAFKVCSEGEIDYHDNRFEPDKGLMKVLEESDDAIDMYLHHLPDYLTTKTVIFLGSSVTYGFASDGVSFADYLCERHDFSMVKEAVTGTTLVDTDSQSYISRMKAIESKECDLFICQLSTNDASLKLPFEDIEAAIDYVIEYVKNKWNCQLAFFTNPRYESAEYEAMVELIKDKSKTHKFLLMNMWDDEEINKKIADKPDYYMADPIHPKKEGYLELFTPFMESFGNF